MHGPVVIGPAHRSVAVRGSQASPYWENSAQALFRSYENLEHLVMIEADPRMMPPLSPKLTIYTAPMRSTIAG